MTDKPDNKTLGTFFLAFVGQKCNITTNLKMQVGQNSPDSGTFPVFYEGILLDFDDEFYYLSENAIEINQAVKRSEVVHIIVSEEKDLFTQILDEMPKGNAN
jgi:hypothetical protein